MRDKKMSRWWIRIQSWRDGKKNLPSSDTAALGETESQIRHAANISIRKAEERYSREVERLKANGGFLQTLYDKTRMEFERLCRKTGRSKAHMPSWGYWLPMIVLSGSEMAFNLWAFAVFQEPEWSTILIGAGVGLCLPLGASFIGKWLRESVSDPGKRTRVWLTSAGLALGLLCLNYFRLVHLRQAHPDTVAANPAMGWAFLGVNFILLLVAAWLKHEATDPEPGFAKAQTDTEKLARQLSDVRGQINALSQQLPTTVEQFREAGLQAIFFYRMWNKRIRTERPPRYFDDPNHPQHMPEIGSRSPQARIEGDRKELLLNATHTPKLLK